MAGRIPKGAQVVEIAGREVTITNPDKVFFPQTGATKMDLVRYFMAVADGAVRGCRDRPTLLKRFPNGIEAAPFFQKRVPSSRPDWIQSAHVRFPSGRTADFLSVHDAAHLIWAINLGCLEMNPWPVRASDVDHPDELRIDLDTTPIAKFEQVRTVALMVREALREHGIDGYPKTSGSRGIHILVRIEPRWGFRDVRRAALALGRALEREDPMLVTTAWWKEERHAPVFLDYNQNARDRTVASAYSVRPMPDGRVSCPITWDEVAGVEPEALRMDTVPERYARIGDPHSPIDDRAYSIEPLLELADRSGAADAPWPPHFPKEEGEPPRVAPSRARKRAVRPKEEKGGGV